MEKKIGDELRAAVKQESSQNSAVKQFLQPEEIDLFPILLDLKAGQMLGDEGTPVSSVRLNEIAIELQKTPPSELQFRALETVAGVYFSQKQTDKLKTIAQAMLESARVLEVAERKKRAEKGPSPFNPYWPRSPFVLSAVFWLQRAGDDTTATAFAREFARNVPDREKPYAAMALFQLGFPDFADSVFDPIQEIPRVTKAIRENQKIKKTDWSLFQSWNEFAAAEARYRAPDAPFRWFGKLDNNARASVLRDWVAALYPPPVQQPPFVNVTLGRSSSSI